MFGVASRWPAHMRRFAAGKRSRKRPFCNFYIFHIAFGNTELTTVSRVFRRLRGRAERQSHLIKNKNLWKLNMLCKIQSFYVKSGIIILNFCLRSKIFEVLGVWKTKWREVVHGAAWVSGEAGHYYMAELILLKSNWAAQNHDILPLSFLLPLGWLKKYGPLWPNFLSHLPLSLPAPSGVAQEVWPSRAKRLEPSAPLPRLRIWAQILNPSGWGVIISQCIIS